MRTVAVTVSTMSGLEHREAADEDPAKEDVACAIIITAALLLATSGQRSPTRSYRYLTQRHHHRFMAHRRQEGLLRAHDRRIAS